MSEKNVVICRSVLMCTNGGEKRTVSYSRGLCFWNSSLNASAVADDERGSVHFVVVDSQVGSHLGEARGVSYERCTDRCVSPRVWWE